MDADGPPDDKAMDAADPLVLGDAKALDADGPPGLEDPKDSKVGLLKCAVRTLAVQVNNSHEDGSEDGKSENPLVRMVLRCPVRAAALAENAGMPKPLAEIIVQYALNFVQWSKDKRCSSSNISIVDDRSVVRVQDSDARVSAVGRVVENPPLFTVTVGWPIDPRRLALWEVGLRSDNGQRWVAVRRKDGQTGQYEVGKQGKCVLWANFKWPTDCDLSEINPNQSTGRIALTFLAWQINLTLETVSVRINCAELIEFGEIKGLGNCRPYVQSRGFWISHFGLRVLLPTWSSPLIFTASG